MMPHNTYWRKLCVVIKYEIKNYNINYKESYLVLTIHIFSFLGLVMQEKFFWLETFSDHSIREVNKGIYLCTIDFEKALESILEAKICSALRKRELDLNMVEAVQSLYRKTINGEVGCDRFRTCKRATFWMNSLLLTVLINEIIIKIKKNQNP